MKRSIRSPSVLEDSPVTLKITPCRKRAVAYYRYATQPPQSFTLKIQQDHVRKYAAEHDIEIIREFVDKKTLGISSERRVGFKAMIRACVRSRRDAFQYVLVMERSRWGRFQNPNLFTHYIGLCLRHGKQVVFTADNIFNFNEFHRYRDMLNLRLKQIRAPSNIRRKSASTAHIKKVRKAL